MSLPLHTTYTIKIAFAFSQCKFFSVGLENFGKFLIPLQLVPNSFCYMLLHIYNIPTFLLFYAYIESCIILIWQLFKAKNSGVKGLKAALYVLKGYYTKEKRPILADFFCIRKQQEGATVS